MKWVFVHQRFLRIGTGIYVGYMVMNWLPYIWPPQTFQAQQLGAPSSTEELVATTPSCTSVSIAKCSPLPAWQPTQLKDCDDSSCLLSAELRLEYEPPNCELTITLGPTWLRMRNVYKRYTPSVQPNDDKHKLVELLLQVRRLYIISKNGCVSSSCVHVYM